MFKKKKKQAVKTFKIILSWEKNTCIAETFNVFNLFS